MYNSHLTFEDQTLCFLSLHNISRDLPSRRLVTHDGDMPVTSILHFKVLRTGMRSVSSPHLWSDWLACFSSPISAALLSADVSRPIGAPSQRALHFKRLLAPTCLAWEEKAFWAAMFEGGNNVFSLPVFQIWQAKARMDEVSGIADQLPLQLCILGDTLAKDANFLNICRGFQVLPDQVFKCNNQSLTRCPS